MVFAGLQKNSLIDYPGKVACVLFVSGCNFTCPFCHNPELALGRYPQRISMKEVMDFLQPRTRLLDGVVITGGEPTLAPGLAELCRQIHEMGLSVKLDTNGSRPDILTHLIEHRRVDYVAMDIKTRVDDYPPHLASITAARRVRESITVLMASPLDHEFRTTCVRPFVNVDVVNDIARTIEGARRYVLQPFRPSTLLQPDFFDGIDAEMSQHTLQQLRSEAAPWVQSCVIRA